MLVDLDWLADKLDGQKSGSGSSNVRWVELPEGASVTIPTEASAYAHPPAPEKNWGVDLFTRLMRCPNLPDTEQRRAISRAVVATPAWTEDPHACFLTLWQRLDGCQPGKEWEMVEGWAREHGDAEGQGRCV